MHGTNRNYLFLHVVILQGDGEKGGVKAAGGEESML